MKKLIILLVCLVIISSSSLFASPFHGGDGTSSNPYQIYNESELLVLINANNATTWSQYYILTNDITCSSSYTATIGNSISTFTGSFDGQNHIISNLTMNLSSYDCVGLFGKTGSNAIVSNLKLQNVSVTNYNSSQGNNTGGLIGYNAGIVHNCSVTGNVTSVLTGSSAYTGGLIGYNDNNSVSLCYAVVAVSGVSSGYYVDTGGLIGCNRGGSVSQCFASGSATGEVQTIYEADTGGLLGTSYNGSISNCMAQVNAVSNGRGGLVGGFIGMTYNSSFENCYATGTASATSTSPSPKIGGFCGNNNNSGISFFTCCYWDTQTSGLNYGVQGDNVANVTGLADLQMRDASNFPCFNKTTIWVFDGLNYPQLRVFFADKVPVLTEWSRYILIFSVLLVGCYFVYRKIYA